MSAHFATALSNDASQPNSSLDYLLEDVPLDAPCSL